MKSYRLQNNLYGWIVWAIATLTFFLTAEKSGSWWDCGEYIATSTKLMVGHPPGAPTFQLLGSIASIFVGRDPALMGYAVNLLSALCSSFTVLFLFWTISMISKMLILNVYRNKDTSYAGIKANKFKPSSIQSIIIFSSAAIGALAYTFSDSFWFSAVEGEVYAMSSFFTAITFWAILKWNNEVEKTNNLRWIIFIAFLIGLAIGVHLLNLLVIPAIVFIIYYRKFEHSSKNTWISLLISIILICGILWGIVPWTVELAGYAELFCVNVLSMPFNSGTIIYFLLLSSILIFFLFYSYKKNRVLLHTGLLCLSFMLLGYSTFMILIVRANADVPINQGENKDAISLLAYLNRDQYGSTPLIYGHYYNAPIISVEPKSPQYKRDEKEGKYVRAGYSSQKINYDPSFCGLFPRIWSGKIENKRVDERVIYNQIWSGTSLERKPTFVENIRFFVRYQLNWMYFRYFMWNFAGRQNDEIGRGYYTDGTKDIFRGNWISGINFIDALRLGPQNNLPDSLSKNTARNTFYFLPLLLGLCGLFFQYKYDRYNCFVVFLLFFMTGLAIAIYLNQPSTEPRERDYTFAGSFYAFAIWVGLGVAALGNIINLRLKASNTIKTSSVLLVSLLCLVSVPGLMAKEGWDDHNRSERTSAKTFARALLESCKPNAVLICDGDNDTFPLWYCQQVEGIRTDVRVINSMLANSSWLLQPLFRKQYESDALKFTIPNSGYEKGENDIVFIQDRSYDYYLAQQLLRYVSLNTPDTKLMARNGDSYNYFPSRNFRIEIPKEKLYSDSIFSPEEIKNMPEEFTWQLSNNSISKSNLAILDIVANNFLTRPIYFITPFLHTSYLSIEHFCSEGHIYRFMPYANNRVQESLNTQETNRINIDRAYDLLVNKLNWDNIPNYKVLADNDTRYWAITTMQDYLSLARALVDQKDNIRAIEVADKCLEYFPSSVAGFNDIYINLLSIYLATHEHEKAHRLGEKLLSFLNSELEYLEQFSEKHEKNIQQNKNKYIRFVANICDEAKLFNCTDLVNASEKILSIREKKHYYQ